MMSIKKIISNLKFYKNTKQKDKYLFSLAKLEIALGEYTYKTGQIHPAEGQLLNYYHNLWGM